MRYRQPRQGLEPKAVRTIRRMLDSGPSGAAWLFVTVALLVVAGASFAAGHFRSRRARSRETEILPQPAVAAAGAVIATASLDPTPAVPAEALAAWAAHFDDEPRPVLLIGPRATGEPRVLLAANAAALKLLGSDRGAIGERWSDLEPAAPASLRALLAEPAAGHPAWWLLHDAQRRHSLLLGSSELATASDDASLGYTVSHDLRAPIRVVEGFTRIVKEDYGRLLDRVGNDHLDRVLAAAARMNLMIDAMLTVARLSTQPLARQPVDLSQIAAFVVDDLRRQSPEHGADVVIEPGLRARGDPTLLRLVLENLLGNAWKYSARCPAPHIEFGTVPHDGRSAFVVRDNGAGFDMRLADRLFGLFQRLHSTKDFPGTGVGLASVKRIVQRHGGEIWAESEPGCGATFYFTLRG
jgi:signal transduction histidine kinase